MPGENDPHPWQTKVRRRFGPPPKRRAADYAYNRESYELPHFGGVVPNVGDLIRYAGVQHGLDCSVIANRRVRQVVRRYFAPQESHDMVRIYLVVTSRPGLDVERSALGG